PENFKNYYTPEFGDQVRVRSFKDGKWGPETGVTGSQESICGTAVAVDGAGKVHVAYSTVRNGSQRLVVRSLTVKDDKAEPGPEAIVDTDAGIASAVRPAMATDSSGVCYLAFQSWRKDGGSTIRWLRRAANTWEPAGITQANHAWHAD